MDDNKILDLYWERSEAAITETASKYSKYCHYISYNILHNDKDADECVNDTYLNAWNSIPPKRPTCLSTYLGKITRNISLNRLKQYNAKKRSFGQTELVLSELENCIPAVQSVEQATDEKILIESINGFLYALPKIKREVFVRRYWYLSSIKDIAEQYGMSESKVASMLFRSRNELKLYLEKEGIII
jgi:RNA polymerase sigma factor (sigma-70 family)